MSIKRNLLVVFVLCMLLLTGGVGPWMTGAAQTLPATQGFDLSGITIPYAGRLQDDAGAPVPDGIYDFAFDLYGSETGGEPLWSEVHEGVQLTDGAFSVLLGRKGSMPVETMDGSDGWLAVGVRGPDEGAFTVLEPRQELSTAAFASTSSPESTSETTSGGSCPHSHWGETWTGDGGSLYLNNTASGNKVWLPGALSGIMASSDTWGGVWGQSKSNIGVYGQSNSGPGVFGDSVDGYGVQAQSDNSHALHIPGAGGSGLYIKGATVHGVHVAAAGSHGVDVASAGQSAVHVRSAGHDGVRVDSANWSGVYVASSGVDAIRVGSAGNDALRIFDAVGRDYIRAGTDPDIDFRVEKDGTVRADGGFHSGADFAELMTTEDTPSAYEPGDVLVISADADRSAALSSEPYSTLVLGVYSTDPGFIGSLDPMGENHDQEIPVAVVGIVSCKVSAENGAIQRGDLLVTSSTPGHAMRAEDAPVGTILGKALESLEEGTGVIQVLVTLQ